MKQKGKTLVDLLEDLYKEFGLYIEHVFSLKFEESRAGKEKQAAIMQRLRERSPTSFGEHQVTSIRVQKAV